jgi:hypothetical protein
MGPQEAGSAGDEGGFGGRIVHFGRKLS